MIKIQQLAAKESAAIAQIVQIHLDTFQGFFLTFMGRGFLKVLYGAYCEHNASGLLTATNEAGEPVGFLAYSEDLSGLYKFMIRKHLPAFFWYALGAFLRKSGIFLRLVRAFLKSGESVRTEAYVELASIGVRPDMKGRGVGSLLIDELKSRVNFERFAYINLETDAENNEGANRFYQKNGFCLARTFVTREGRKMNEYHYRR